MNFLSAISPEAERSRVCVLLRLREVEVKREALADPIEASTVEGFKDFCRELRLAKLRYLDNDRQEPGVFDDGAGQLIEWTDEVLKLLEDAPDERSFRLVFNGISEHRKELAEHLGVAVAQRRVIR